MNKTIIVQRHTPWSRVYVIVRPQTVTNAQIKILGIRKMEQKAMLQFNIEYFCDFD